MSIEKFSSHFATTQDPALIACLKLRQRTMDELTRCHFMDWRPWHEGDQPIPPGP